MAAPIILHGNNLDLLRELPDNSIDSIVTDPPYELGFMGKKWDSSGIAYSVELWSECLRVLKSGGHLLAFSGSRTYHRMVVAIEDAGFEIRDQIMWVYGSGFPKSLDISKAIDKAAGAERTVVGSKITGGIKRARPDDAEGYSHSYSVGQVEVPVTAPATDEAQQWSGWGTALKPSHEPFVMARKPIDGTVANNVLKHGVGGINIDGCRVPTTDVMQPAGGDLVQNNQVYGKGLGVSSGKSAELSARFPANFIHDGSEEVTDLTGEAARFFYCAKASKAERNAGLEGLPLVKGGAMAGGNDTRNGDREQLTLRQNFHPTVKPIALMRYLVRLVTPPNGTVLDPFAGSGSTLVAAILEGFSPVGMELTADYLPIINARVEWALAQEPDQPSLF